MTPTLHYSNTPSSPAPCLTTKQPFHRRYSGWSDWAREVVSRMKSAVPISLVAAGMALLLAAPGARPESAARALVGAGASLEGRRPFPDDNPWNQDVSGEPVDPA